MSFNSIVISNLGIFLCLMFTYTIPSEQLRMGVNSLHNKPYRIAIYTQCFQGVLKDGMVYFFCFSSIHFRWNSFRARPSLNQKNKEHGKES